MENSCPDWAAFYSWKQAASYIMKFYCLLPFFIFVASAFAQNTQPDLMAQLKSMMAQKDRYDKQKERNIQILKNELRNSSAADLSERYRLSSCLFDEYKSYQYDSAYVYTQKMLYLSKQLKDLPKWYESQIKLGVILISSGMFKETLDCLNKVEPTLLKRQSRANYYRLKCVYFSSLAAYNRDKYYTKDYIKQANQYLDSAIALSDKESFEHIMYQAEVPDTVGQKVSNYQYYEYLLHRRKLTPHQTAMIAAALSDRYTGEDRMNLLYLAAINDIRASIKETSAVYKIGANLYQAGDIKNAYLFMQEALNNAEYYGSRLHKIEIASVLPEIANKKILLAENEKSRFIIYLLSAAMVVMLISLVSFIIFIQLKKVRVKGRIIADKNNQLEKINSKLFEDTRIKEEYIGHFFDAIADNILTLEKLKRAAERKLKNTRADEVLSIFNQVNIQQERADLYRTFDKIFLKLFPDFVSDFNALLQAEDQIVLKDQQVLNAQLRIFALVRLGINDNETIAKILQYSVSTVYTYKFRIKAKAVVPAEMFDHYVMEIKVI